METATIISEQSRGIIMLSPLFVPANKTILNIFTNPRNATNKNEFPYSLIFDVKENDEVGFILSCAKGV